MIKAKADRWIKMGFQRLFLLFFLLQFQNQGWAQVSQPPKSNSCVSCHSDIQEDMNDSIHTRQGVFCDKCHGGDPAQTTKELAKGPGTGYFGIPDKKKIAEVCGQCHADVETMNFYGLRTDQLARYKTSKHGKKLFQERDEHVAVCSDCHGEHNILPVSDPGSSVYPLNLPRTCNRCHGNEKLMASYKLPSDIFKIYRSSVHGKALLDKKDMSAASCTSCHGDHGAVPPGVRDIGTTCGKCHGNEKKYFLESVHFPASERGAFSECISCHGNHGVKRASKALYAEVCIRCHSADSAAMKTGEKIAAKLSDAEDQLRSAEDRVKQASIEGIFVEPEAASLEMIKTDVIAMAPLQHTLSLTKISELHAKVVSVAQDVETKIHGKRQGLRWRKLSLIPIWAFIVVMISALWLKYLRLKSQGHSKKS